MLWILLAPATGILSQRLQSADRVRLAVIGDYGDGSQAAADVAALVRAWQPDYVITTGDNNYPKGEAATIDGNVGLNSGEIMVKYWQKTKLNGFSYRHPS